MILLLKMMPAKKSSRFFFVSLVFMLYMFPQVYAATPHSTPHVWLDPVNAKKTVAAIVQSFKSGPLLGEPTLK